MRLFRVNTALKEGCVSVIVLLAVLQLNSAKTLTKITEENCEVCVKFLTRFIDGLSSDQKSTPAKIEDAFREKCKTTKKDDNRFCYYIGGLEESATGLLGEMSKPVSWSMPADKVCQKLYKKDQQICDLKYDVTLDLATVNLKKLKVKDLKAILSDWDEQCKGCTEKNEYIAKVEKLMPKYAPEAYAKREKSEL